MSSDAEVPYIVCEDLFKIYKIADLEVVALRGLDLKVGKGEMVAVVGASGSGKTTLLNILAGYDIPSAGRVTVGTRDLLMMASSDTETYRRREVGFVWQQTGRNLFPYLTVVENVELPMMIINEDPLQRIERSKALVEMVGLGHRMGHKPDELSGGEQQRAAIAVAFANNPPLLLADEPTGELDDATADEILTLLGTINRDLHTTIVIVTHDSNIVRKVDRVVKITDGKTSTELVRSRKAVGDSEKENRTAINEYVLIDGAGRVQIPDEILDQIDIGERAKITLEEGKVTIFTNDD